MKGFEKLIEFIPQDSRVLDIGCGGLSGENTTNYLIKRFKDITGICRRSEEAQKYADAHPDIPFIFNEFNKVSRKPFHDLVVYDLNIENNILSWEAGFKDMLSYLKPEGYLITYVMTTTEYGDNGTPNYIREHWERFYGQPQSGILNNELIGKKMQELADYEFIASEVEERRPYITWVCLKRKISGL